MLQSAELTFTALDSLRRAYDAMPHQLAFRASTRAEWAAWRAELQSTLVGLLGGFPRERCPLQPVALETVHESGYRVEKVAYQSEPGLHVPCYVMIPDHVAPPYRPVIALHGHGTGGAAHIMGRPLKEETRAKEEEHILKHNTDYARQLVRRGFLVFVPVQRGLGERVETAKGMSRWEGAGLSSCQALQTNALLLGKTVLGMRVWDVVRTLDYIATRPERMLGTIGCLGLSGGGTTTLFAAALDERISVAVISGAFNTFRASIMAMIHCDCNYVPGILKYAEMADIAGLIAPRPLLVESGTRDGIFPSTATEAAFGELARVYGLLGVPDRLDKDIFEGDHQFSGRKAFDWLDRWLR